MATDTPPPYFPQSSLSPPDPDRYRKFKLLMVLGAALLILVLAGAVAGAVYLVKWMM